MIRCFVLAAILAVLSYLPATAAHNLYYNYRTNGHSLHSYYPYYGHSPYHGRTPYDLIYPHYNHYPYYGHNPYCR